MKQQSMSLRTTLENFLNHAETLETKKAEGEDLYEQEFQLLKTLSESLRCLPQYSCSYGEKDTNRRKNRYKDILPYDYTRVSLSEIPGVPGSDYVNANYIKGASGSLAYIASQGPLPHTVEDFWRMIWECEVQVVVMASSEMEGGKHKCERYWPYEDEERTFGNLTTTLLRFKQVCSDFLVRTIKVSSSDEERTVIQFHYMSWPDHGIPDAVSPILNMTKLVRDCQSSETLPVLVHCSAGCGRTGTICAIDYVWGLLRAGKLTDDFSLFQLISEMRKQRIAMVQTKEQYILVHRAVKELFEQHLKVMDSHHYENVDFSGCPMIKNDVDYEFIDVEDPDAKSLGKASDANTHNSDTDASEDLRRSAERVGVCDPNRKVPPLPRKRRTALPPANPKESDSDSCESQVRLLISTWNHGKPLPVEKPDDETNMDEEDRSTTDERITEDLDSLDKRHSPTEIILKGELLPTDKAVVIRKPSIAKLRAIFEKNSDSGSPTSDTTEVPFARRTKHKKKDKLNLTDEPSESSLQSKPSKRSRSPFKKSGSDNPEMRTVSTRYKDTALKVYSEFKQRDSSQDKSDDGITPSESSPGSSRTEKSPPPERRPSPTVPEFLRRVGSRRGTPAANRTTSVWYDQASAGDESKPEDGGRPEEKPALPVKRSKSMKVQSITENAFGLFRLPSPIRQRKVAAYLGVEDSKSSKESSPVPSSSGPINAALCEIPELSPNPDATSIRDEQKPGTPEITEGSFRQSPDRSPPKHVENLLSSPKIFRRFYSRSVSNSEKVPNEDVSPPKEKPKLRYLFGDRQPDVVAGSGTDQPVQLVRVRSKSDDAPYCRPVPPDVIPSMNATTSETTIHEAGSIHSHHSLSVSHSTPGSFSEDSLPHHSSGHPTSKTVTNVMTSSSSSTSPSSVITHPPLKTEDISVVSNDTKESTRSASSIVHPHYVNVLLAEGIPPPLPAKKSSPANSPLIHRQTKAIIIPEDPHVSISSSLNTQFVVMKVPSACSSSTHSEVPLELPITDSSQSTETVQSTTCPLNGISVNTPLMKETTEINANTVVPLPSESQKAFVSPKLSDEVAEVSSETDKVNPSTVDEDDSYQQIIRDCQEYLLSSGYSNVFPEMSRNLMMIEQSLEKHPRGGFVDILSSIDDLSSTNDSKPDIRLETAQISSTECKRETDETLINRSDDKETCSALKKDANFVSQGHKEIAAVVDTYIPAGNDFARASSPCFEMADSPRDYCLEKDNSTYNEGMSNSCNNSTASPTAVSSTTQDLADEALTQSCKVPFEVPHDPAMPVAPAIDSTVNPVIRPEYEHLWLSQSGDLPALVKDNDTCVDATRVSYGDEETSSFIYKTPPVVSKETSQSPTKESQSALIRRGSFDSSGGKDAASSLLNKERASSASPQLSRIPVRCKRANSKHKDKDVDNKSAFATSSKAEKPTDLPLFSTNSGCGDGEVDDVFGGLSSPKLLKELTYQSLVDKLHQKETGNVWQLNSYKMVKDAISSTSPTDECPKVSNSFESKHNTLGDGDGDGPNAPLNRAIEEMENLAQVMEKTEQLSSDGFAKEKLEAPVKPARSQGDSRPRKPQPLPRSILPGKHDTPIKINATVINQELQSPAIRSLERKKRKESLGSSGQSSQVLPSDKSMKSAQPAVCEDREYLKGVIKCAVKSDENAFIYRPRRDRVVTLGLSPPVSNGKPKEMVENAKKLNHEYEELDLKKSPPKMQKKKVENEYEEIFFREAVPSHEKLIDIAKRASAKEGKPIRPTHTRQRSTDLSESSLLEEDKRKSGDSAVLKGVLLLPIAGKVEIQCTPEQIDAISPSNHVYETVGSSVTRQHRRADSKTMIPKYAMVTSETVAEERRPMVRKRSSSAKRRSLSRKASLDAAYANEPIATLQLENVHQEKEVTYSQLDKDQKSMYNPQDLYSEVSKERSKLTHRRCLVDSPSSQRHSNRKLRYSKDDLELCPVVPPRVKRQSSASLRRNTVLDTSVGSDDSFWWTHTLPGRLNNPSLAMQVSKWGDEWDSDEDCQPPVPAKTREAYMLPQPDSSSSGSSTVTPTDISSPGHGQDHPFTSKTKAHTKFNLLSRFGLKNEGKGSDANATTPGVRPARSSAAHHSTPKPTGQVMPGFGFPHRLPKKPHGPRDPPSNWQFATPNRST